MEPDPDPREVKKICNYLNVVGQRTTEVTYRLCLY